MENIGLVLLLLHPSCPKLLDFGLQIYEEYSSIVLPFYELHQGIKGGIHGGPRCAAVNVGAGYSWNIFGLTKGADIGHF